MWLCPGDTRAMALHSGGSDLREGPGLQTHRSLRDGLSPGEGEAGSLLPLGCLDLAVGASKGGTASPSCSIPTCPLGPKLHHSPQAHPILCLSLGITALSWPPLGAPVTPVTPVTHLPPCCPGYSHGEDRDGDGDGDGVRVCIHLGLSQVCRVCPHPPAMRPRRRCHCTGFYGHGKDFSHQPGRGTGWQAGRRPLVAGCETRECCLGDGSAINSFN